MFVLVHVFIYLSRKQTHYKITLIHIIMLGKHFKQSPTVFHHELYHANERAY